MSSIENKKIGIAIVGAGGLGREMHSWISTSEKHSEQYNILGFLDDTDINLSNYKIETKVIGKITDNDFSNYENIILAINNSEFKREMFSKIDHSKTNIIGFIHDSCIIGANSEIDKSVMLFPKTLISCNVELKRGIFINCGSQIGHDTTVDEFTNIMALVEIGGNCKIGKNVLIGSGATIYPGVSIADNTVIGAGSMVFRSIKIAGTYIGNPAKKIF